MALNTLGALAAALFLVGCTSGGGKVCDTADSGGCDSGTDTGDTDTGDTDDTEDTDLSFTTTWSTDAGVESVALSITNGSGTYAFGMAEESAGGWLGETCLGEPAGPGRGGDYEICHDGASSTGLVLDSVFPDLDAVLKNDTTLMTTTIHEAGHLAYALIASDGECWEANDADENLYDCQ